MAYSLGFGEPERFAALAVLSSWLPQDLLSALPDMPATEQLPVLVEHGSRDEQVDIGRARQPVETLRNLRVPLTSRHLDMRHELGAISPSDLSARPEENVL